MISNVVRNRDGRFVAYQSGRDGRGVQQPDFYVSGVVKSVHYIVE